MTPDGPPLSKLPDGKTLAFTMEVRQWIDALLWEDEEHEPWTEKNLELRYIADAAADNMPPTVHGWKLILECAESDYKTTRIKDFGELCREIILTCTDEDPGEWIELKRLRSFQGVWTDSPRFRNGGVSRNRGEDFHVDVDFTMTKEDLEKAMKTFIKYSKDIKGKW